MEDNQKERQSLKERAESAEELVAKLENDLANLIGGNTNTEGLSTLDVLKSTTSDHITDAAFVPIITAQRNRLHEKCTLLEEQLSNEKTRQMTVQTEIEKVRDDNVKLYEKIRLLQGGYNKHAIVPMDDDQKSYKKFGDRRMQLHDRATLSLGKAILSSSQSRMIFFFYLLVLHLLIMMVLYKYAFDQASTSDQEIECEYKFQQHMIEKHEHH